MTPREAGGPFLRTVTVSGVADSVEPDAEPESAPASCRGPAPGMAMAGDRKVEAVLLKLLSACERLDGYGQEPRNIWCARAGHFVQISEDAVTWPDGTKSQLVIHGDGHYSVNLDGQTHTAKMVGDKLFWDDDDVWTYVGEETLDGFWRTASCSLVQISGNIIAWTSGSRSWLMVKSSDEISVNVHGETYLAQLLGGKLHWDDGDVWSRQHHQELVLHLDDIRVGATLQVLEDPVAVLGACHRAGLGSYKDDKRAALAGCPVQALKKEYYDNTIKCLVPDGGTVWFAVSALTLPQAPAALLHVVSPHGQHELAGDYKLDADASSSGMPIWKHMHSDYWLYTSMDGRWCLGDGERKKSATSAGLIVNDEQHWGIMPHQLRGSWKRFDGKRLVVDKDIAITNITRRSTADIDMENIDKMLRALPPHASPDVPEHVWKEWAKTVPKFSPRSISSFSPRAP